MITDTQSHVIHWLADENTGTSSETMAFWLGFGVLRAYPSHPSDPSDFNRCVGLLKAAPGLRADLINMAKVSLEWSRLIGHWTQIEKTLSDEVGPDWSKHPGTPAKKTWRLMKLALSGETSPTVS